MQIIYVSALNFSHLRTLKYISADPAAKSTATAIFPPPSGSTDGASLTIAHTTSGTDRLMLVGVSINNYRSETVTSVTYNGINLSYVGAETQNDDARVEIWKLVAPPTGTYNVVINFSADLQRYAVAGVITFTGVNQTTPLGSGSSFAAAWEFASFAGKLQSSQERGQFNYLAAGAAREVKARPRQEKGLRMLLPLSRRAGVIWRSYYEVYTERMRSADAARIAMREESNG